MLAIAGITATGCLSCQSENEEQDGVELLKLGSNRVISTHLEGVSLSTPKDWDLHWMQAEATWTSLLTDASAGDATLMELTDGFQAQKVVDEQGGTVCRVTIVTTNTMSTDSQVLDHSFYLDNYPLDDKAIVLSFEDAWQRALEANCEKPQTRVAVLRSPVGPVHVDDAYYIFGHSGGGSQPFIFVNARTGDVSTSNPAFLPAADAAGVVAGSK